MNLNSVICYEIIFFTYYIYLGYDMILHKVFKVSLEPRFPKDYRK